MRRYTPLEKGSRPKRVTQRCAYGQKPIPDDLCPTPNRSGAGARKRKRRILLDLPEETLQELLYWARKMKLPCCVFLNRILRSNLAYLKSILEARRAFYLQGDQKSQQPTPGGEWCSQEAV